MSGFTRRRMTYTKFSSSVPYTSHQTTGENLARSSGHNCQQEIKLSEILVFTFQLLATDRSFQIPCTNLIDAGQLIKSQISRSRIWQSWIQCSAGYSKANFWSWPKSYFVSLNVGRIQRSGISCYAAYSEAVFLTKLIHHFGYSKVAV